MQVYLLLTEECNLHCPMCIRGRQKGMNLSYEELLNVFHKNDFHNDEIVITGGEPTFHKDFSIIVNEACKNAGNVAITSNGTNYEELMNLPEFSNIRFQISLDGDCLTHDSIRGSGTYEKVFKVLTELDKMKRKYVVASVVNKTNARSMKALADELKRLRNMLYWRISYEMPFGSARYSEVLPPDEWNEFVDDILNYAKVRLKIKKLFPFDLYEKNIGKLEEGMLLGKRVMNCGSGRDKIYVYPDLKVYPCTCLTDFCVGDLKVSTLKEILSGELIRDFSEYKLNHNSSCNECEYFKFCNGGCIGMSYHYYGKLGMGDIRCPKQKR